MCEHFPAPHRLHNRDRGSLAAPLLPHRRWCMIRFAGKSSIIRVLRVCRNGFEHIFMRAVKASLATRPTRRNTALVIGVSTSRATLSGRRDCQVYGRSEEATVIWIVGSTGGRGGPRLFSVLRSRPLSRSELFGLSLRQTEALVGDLLCSLRLDHLPIPDHSTLSRRVHNLRVVPGTNPSKGSIHLVVESTGLQVIG